MRRISVFLMMIMSLLMITSYGTAQESDRAINEEFLDIFDYEIQNRAFAINTFEVKLAEDDDFPMRPFYEAYYAMEVINKKKYAPYASKYGLDTAPRWWTRTRTKLGLMVGDLFQDKFMEVMHNATVKYVGKLQRLEELAPDEDNEFFTYVVAQEQVQADAIGFLIDGDLNKAVARINDFVTSQQTQ